MALPRGLPVVDHHCHLSPDGEGIRAAERFRAAGGTHLFLATQNYARRPLTALQDYRDQFEITEQLARRVREEAAVEVYPVVAPYPIDLVEAAAVLGIAPALDLHRSALDLAGEWVREHRAVALGEVGHPHFPVEPALVEAGDRAFAHALSVARDVGCPVVVHSADLDPGGYRNLADEAARVGLPPAKVVKHYARHRVGAEESAGIAPSYLARRELVRSVAHDPAPWFLETDFLDDPSRPGAVLDLETVPRRARMLSEALPDEGERLWVPFVESVERVYGHRPEVRPEGP